MNNVKTLFQASEDIAQFAQGYLRHVFQLADSIDITQLKAFKSQLFDARKNGNTIFVVGNGGSAATASHLATDLGVCVPGKTCDSDPFRLMALTNSLSCITAIGNDDSYDHVFVKQLRVHYRRGDKLIVVSCSGNSLNVVNAAKWVKDAGGCVLGLLGFNGGLVKSLCDQVILVEAHHADYGPVEDVHIIIEHLLSNWLILRMNHISSNP